MLDDIDLTVEAGTVTALLGPNGAGKTTTVHILSTLLAADGGTAQVDGYDVVRDPDGVRAAIGLTGQFSAVDGLLTGEENLLLMAELRHLGRRRGTRAGGELLEQFDLVEAARKPLATYSGGMQRRLDLAMTLVATRSVIFLDEPTTGLDPRSRRTMWDIVRAPGRGRHDRPAHHPVPGRGGRARGPHRGARRRPDRRRRARRTELKRLVPGGHIRLRFADAATLDAAARAARRSARDDDGARAHRAERRRRRRAAHRAGPPRRRTPSSVDDLSIHTPDLDDVFFALTGDDDQDRHDHVRACDQTPPTMLRRNDAAPQPLHMCATPA